MELCSFSASYVELLRKGDFETERHFTSYFGELLQIKLRARWLPREVVEDIQQETFARVLCALRGKSAIREPHKLGAFVNSVCNNTLLEFYRSSSRSQSLQDYPRDAADRMIDLDGMLATKETEARVAQVLAQLPRNDSRLLRAIFLQERDKDEICREFGVNRNYLRVLLHRAKDKFKSSYTRPQRGQAHNFTRKLV